MTASLRGLTVLGAIALALGGVVLADCGSKHDAVDHALVPGLDPDKLDSLRWERPGKPDVSLERKAGAWVWRDPPGAADAAAVSDVLAALRGARWHRRESAQAAGVVTATLVVAGRTIGIGQPLAGADQAWLVLDGAALLVDGWVARALAPAPLALRVRHPLDGAAASGKLVLGRDQLTGHPRRMISPSALAVDPALIKAIEQALADLEVVGLPEPGMAQSERIQGLSIELDHASLVAPRLGLSCAPGQVPFGSPAGDGCVDRARWQAIIDLAIKLDGSPDGIVDRRPVPFQPVTLALPAGKLDLAKRPQLDGHDADPDRVAELVGALAAPADVVPVPGDLPLGTIVAVDRDGNELALDVFDHVLVRRDEPVGLRPSAAAWATLMRPAGVYRDPTRWIEEPTTVASIAIDAASYKRGATIGAWPGAKDPKLVEALVAAVATVRAPDGPAPSPIVHRVTFTTAPPVGSPATHRLQIGALTAAGCRGIADDQPVAVPLAVCTAIQAAAP